VKNQNLKALLKKMQENQSNKETKDFEILSDPISEKLLAGSLPVGGDNASACNSSSCNNAC